MMLMRANSGRSGGVTLSHDWPSFRVTWISPSSEPAQMRPFSSFDGARANTVAKISGPFMSRVIGPPESPSVLGSARVRSPLIAFHDCPPSVVFHTCCELV